jgi:WD40 repeat protein
VGQVAFEAGQACSVLTFGDLSCVVMFARLGIHQCMHLSLHLFRFVVSTDKDGKVRVSILPAPEIILHGAYQIQSFCVGHLNYATSAAFSTPPAGAQGSEPGRPLLVTGSGDGSVRLWDHITGGAVNIQQAD